MVTPPVPLQDTDKITFGKYLGKRLIDIPAEYFLWLYNEGCSHAGVRAYINENLQVLNQQAKRRYEY